VAPNPATRWLERPIDILVLAVGWWLIVLSFATCVEMVSRKLFAFSLQGVDEVGGYTLAIVGAIGFSYTLVTRGHTRIDFLVGKLPLRARSVLNVLAMVTLAGMAVFAVLRGWVVLSESIEFQSRSTTPLQTPIWIPQSLWLLGWALFCIATLAMAVHAVALLLRGRHAEINTVYGPQTLDEEIEAEAGEVLADLAAKAKP
jgi:TRAP-type mannitol/chloroaromatic compound transport system permease small subunit